jgi:hypothetical protein
MKKVFFNLRNWTSPSNTIKSGLLNGRTDTEPISTSPFQYLKESQAEKEKTREVRKQLDEFKEQVEKVDAAQEEHIQRKIEKLKEREDRVKKKQPQVAEPVLQEETEKNKFFLNKKIKPRLNMISNVTAPLSFVTISQEELHSASSDFPKLKTFNPLS